MKTNKVKFGYVNKKLVAGLLSLGLVSSTLVGCPAVTLSQVEYKTDENGYIVSIEGTISEALLHDCSFSKVTNNITEETYYTIVVDCFSSYDASYNSYDLFTDQNLTKGNFEIEQIDSVDTYLIAFNKLKSEYTDEDLRGILNEFIAIQEKKEEDKKLIKE